jgi:hypothetical protein
VAAAFTSVIRRASGSGSAGRQSPTWNDNRSAASATDTAIPSRLLSAPIWSTPFPVATEMESASIARIVPGASPSPPSTTTAS